MQTLADVFITLRDGGAGFVLPTTREELAKLEDPSEHTGHRVFRVIPVYVTPQDKAINNEIFMIFVDNGTIYYTQGDILTDYVLDEDCFLPDNSFDYETLLNKLFLDGSGELASFGGFFILQ